MFAVVIVMENDSLGKKKKLIAGNQNRKDMTARMSLRGFCTTRLRGFSSETFDTGEIHILSKFFAGRITWVECTKSLKQGCKKPNNQLVDSRQFQLIKLL